MLLLSPQIIPTLPPLRTRILSVLFVEIANVSAAGLNIPVSVSLLNPYPGAPRIHIEMIKPYVPIQVKDLRILPLLVNHGELEVLGFRINDLTYITDAKQIPRETIEKIRGSKVLILNALHHKPHYLTDK